MAAAQADVNPAASPAGPVIRVEGLNKRFGTKLVLQDIAFEVRAGEFVAILGPSGAGKTTLFRCLTLLERPDEGRIYVGGRALHEIRGRDLRNARRDIGLIFQQFNLIRRLTAIDNVLVGRLGHASTPRVLFHAFERTDRQLARASLDRVGLLDVAHQRSDRLSGGQQQRVAIARVLAQQCKYILADEPVASLDPVTSANILSTLRNIAHDDNLVVLCSLHQVEFATSFADRIIGLRAGRRIADVSASRFSETEHARIYLSEPEV